MRKMFGMIVCVALLAGSAMAELVENPAYQNWAKHKPGTSVTYLQESGMGGMNMQMEMTQTLKEVTPEKAVLEMSIKSSMMPGGGQKHTTDIPAKIEQDQVQTAGKMPEGFKGESKTLGKESVKVGDKSYECEVTEFKGEGQGMTMEGKSWTSDEVPGHLVKLESKGTTGQGNIDSKMTLKSVEAK